MTANVRMAALAACVLSVAASASAQEATRAASVGLTLTAAGGAESAIAGPEREAFAQGNTRADQGPKLKGFSVVLLSGETPGATTSGEPSGEIPAAVQKALSNVQAFLPYKTYRLYDAALLPPPNNQSRALMRGDVNTRLIVSLSVPSVRSQPGPLPVTLVLSEMSSALPTSNANENPVRTVMNANISISIGETVVVGTSRIGGGGRALIALLTAIPE